MLYAIEPDIIRTQSIAAEASSADKGIDAAAEAETRSTDGNAEEVVSSHTGLPSDEDAAVEGDLAYRDRQNELAMEIDDASAKSSIQDLAYREEQPDVSGEDRQKAEERQASGDYKRSSSQEMPQHSSSSHGSEEPTAGEQLVVQDGTDSEDVHTSKDSGTAQNGGARNNRASDRHPSTASAKEQPSSGQTEQPGSVTESSRSKPDKSCDEVAGSAEGAQQHDLLRSQPRPAQEQGGSQAEDGLTDAASVMSLDLGEGTQSLETSDAESLATGMGLDRQLS